MKKKMKTSEVGLNLIKFFEDFRSKAYLCPAKVWTIGYGHTGGVKSTDTISKEDANSLLLKDLEKYEKAVNTLVSVDLNQNQFDAITSFTFNLGEGALAKSTLLKKLNAKDYKGAAEEFLKWNKAGGQVLAGLVKRREKEKELFLK